MNTFRELNKRLRLAQGRATLARAASDAAYDLLCDVGVLVAGRPSYRPLPGACPEIFARRVAELAVADAALEATCAAVVDIEIEMEAAGFEYEEIGI